MPNFISDGQGTGSRKHINYHGNLLKCPESHGSLFEKLLMLLTVLAIAREYRLEDSLRLQGQIQGGWIGCPVTPLRV